MIRSDLHIRQYRDFLEEKHLEGLSPHEVVKTCLNYLSFDVFAEGPCPDSMSLERRLKDYKFSHYASQFWGFHAQGEPEKVPGCPDRYYQNVNIGKDKEFDTSN